MSARIDTGNETPIWVRSGREDLLAVMTRPEQSSDLGVVLFTGGGWMPSTHRNRMYVDLARHLAAMGCTVMRFDYAGVGDSTGHTRFFDSMAPHVEDALAVAEALQATGVNRLVLAGTCYGGRTALAASESIGSLVGLVLSAAPVKDYGGSDRSLGWHARMAWSMRTLKRIRTRYPKYLRILKVSLRRATPMGGPGLSNPVSRRYLKALEVVLSRGVRVLLLEGTHDKHHPAYLAAMEGSLGRLLAAHPDLVAMAEIDGELHGELWPEGQAFTRDRVVEFVAGILA